MNLWCTTFTTPRAFARQRLATDRRPSRRHARSSSVAIAGGTAGLALALTGAAAADNPNPCDLVEHPPTLSQCWNCFAWQVQDCQAIQGDELAKQACLKAANSFYDRCVEEFWGPTAAGAAGVLKENADLTADVELDLRSTTSLEMRLPVGVDDGFRIRAYVEVGDAVQSEQLPLEVSVMPSESNEFLYQIEIAPPADTNINRTDAVVVVVEEPKTGEVRYAYAFQARAVDPFDLNDDGAFDHADKVEAVRRFAEGELDKERLDAILAAGVSN